MKLPKCEITDVTIAHVNANVKNVYLGNRNIKQMLISIEYVEFNTIILKNKQN